MQKEPALTDFTNVTNVFITVVDDYGKESSHLVACFNSRPAAANFYMSIYKAIQLARQTGVDKYYQVLQADILSIERIECISTPCLSLEEGIELETFEALNDEIGNLVSFDSPLIPQVHTSFCNLYRRSIDQIADHY